MEARGLDPQRRAIGMSGGGVRQIKAAEVIRLALSDKTHAYGDLDRPYLIALALDSFDRDEELDAALYGGPAVRAKFNQDGSMTSILVRDLGGYWSRGDAPGRSRVSGLLVLSNALPYGIARSSPSLWVHPRADRAAPVLPFWRTVEVSGTELKIVDPAIAPWEFYGLEEGWPIGAAFGGDA